MRISLLAPLIAFAACSPTPAAVAPTPVIPTAPAVAPPVAATGTPTLDQLVQGQKVRGFTVTAVYLDDAGLPAGARFVHDQTGFQLDYLRIESAPEARIWVTSYPTSDQGEPHTQEHLLLTKGNRGRRLGSNEAMALVQMNAFTEQWLVSYLFRTVAGPDAYWGALADQLDALLNPDYTDEEIRREVRNFGVDKTPDGTLHLEEKGTVYNEMIGYYEDSGAILDRTARQLVYGKTHPLALESGGLPAAIRTMTAADIRAFHAAHYFLGNMGMIGAYPSAMSLDSVLDHTGQILAKAAGRTGKVVTAADLPAPAAAATGTTLVVDYPYGDTANPSPLELIWPAALKLDLTERTLAGLFLDAFAGDSSTPMYKELVDSKSRVLDLGATDVRAQIASDEGEPISLVVDGVHADKLDAATLDAVRGLVARELDHLAKLPDGDRELIAFDQQVKSRVVALRRSLGKLLDTPPGFGNRNENDPWFAHLYALGHEPGFRKSLTLRPELERIEQLLAGARNPWRTRIHAWGLDGTPYGVASRPSPELRKQLDMDRDHRLAAELARLQQKYGTKDAAATLVRYAQDYDAATHQLDASAKAAELPPLVASPPMTLDDSLQYDTGEVGATRTFAARFDTMTSVRVQLAFSLADAVPEADEVFLAALPALLGDAGVIEGGAPISAAQVAQRVREEILALDVSYIGNPRTHRTELVVEGAGAGVGETRTALAWMRRLLFAPDWRVDNAPRLRDLLAQQETELRQRLLGYEEHWVNDPRDAWAQQDPIEAHTQSLLTELHDLHRLRWMLSDPRDPAVTREVGAFLAQLAGAKSLHRAELAELATALAQHKPVKAAAAKRYVDAAAKLSVKARALVQSAGVDLAATLADLPDDSLAIDWDYLCREMAKDLTVGVQSALTRLAAVREQLVQGQRARLVEVGSTANEHALAKDVAALVAALPVPAAGSGSTTMSSGGQLRARLVQREPAAKQGTTFVGLVMPSLSSGVFVNLAPAPWYGATSDDDVLDYLASNLYTGHGGHSIYSKTLAAGLAYSNGLHPHVDAGTLDYYAERCPLLSQTIHYVVDQLRAARPDANIARYAIANAFSSRLADAYEERAGEMAANLVDGIPPDLVRAFRSHILELAKRADFTAAVFARMPAVYGRVLPGYTKLAPDGTYFVIGPEKQMAAYQDYLHAAVGKTARLFRLYPRDFWIPAKL